MLFRIANREDPDQTASSAFKILEHLPYEEIQTKDTRQRSAGPDQVSNLTRMIFLKELFEKAI